MFLVKDEERGRSALKCHWTTFLREPVCNYLSPEHITYVQTHALHTSHMIYMKFWVLVLFKVHQRLQEKLLYFLFFLSNKNCNIFVFSEHPSHTPVGYGEIPKSCTIENRQNLIEHQLYATIQRKQPPVPPFTSGKILHLILHHI